MNRKNALRYVAAILDDSLNVRTNGPVPDNAVLIGYQCGFEPLFIAVHSYLPGITLDSEDAAEIAKDYLQEKNWFADPDADNEPDFIF